MHRVALGVLVLLAACAAPKPPGSYRNPQAPIYSSAVFDASRLAGRWMQAADFAAPGANCTLGNAEFTSTTNGLHLAARLCLSGQATRLSGPVNPTAPGRLAIDGMEPWWVLWVDADYRTLVIGAPSGAFGFILNRDGPLPADRLTAASDIFEWNGYDISHLVTR